MKIGEAFFAFAGAESHRQWRPRHQPHALNRTIRNVFDTFYFVSIEWQTNLVYCRLQAGRFQFSRGRGNGTRIVHKWPWDS